MIGLQRYISIIGSRFKLLILFLMMLISQFCKSNIQPPSNTLSEIYIDNNGDWYIEFLTTDYIIENYQELELCFCDSCSKVVNIDYIQNESDYHRIGIVSKKNLINPDKLGMPRGKIKLSIRKIREPEKEIDTIIDGETVKMYTMTYYMDDYGYDEIDLDFYFPDGIPQVEGDYSISCFNNCDICATGCYLSSPSSIGKHNNIDNTYIRLNGLLFDGAGQIISNIYLELDKNRDASLVNASGKYELKLLNHHNFFQSIDLSTKFSKPHDCCPFSAFIEINEPEKEKKAIINSEDSNINIEALKFKYLTKKDSTVNIHVKKVEFYKEDLTFEISSDTFYVDGTYYLKNNYTSAIKTVLFYPIPSGEEYGDVIDFSIENIDAGPNNIKIIKKDEFGVLFSIVLNPSCTNRCHITYNQSIKNNQAEYILSTTQHWRAPLDSAKFRLIVPNKYKMEYFSYTPFKIDKKDNKQIYSWEFCNFYPRKNMLFRYD